MKLASLDFTALQELAETLRLELYENHPKYSGHSTLVIRCQEQEVFETDIGSLDHVRAFLLGWITRSNYTPPELT